MPRIHNLIPMAHVANVDRSVAFYSQLGFAVGDTLKDGGGTYWASVSSDRAELMFARASGSVDPTQQAILFYLYSPDLTALRTHLLGCGLRDAGPFTGCPMLGAGRGAVSTITYPEYMQKGEFRIEDPDGYCLLVGQLE